MKFDDFFCPFVCPALYGCLARQMYRLGLGVGRVLSLRSNFSGVKSNITPTPRRTPNYWIPTDLVRRYFASPAASGKRRKGEGEINRVACSLQDITKHIEGKPIFTDVNLSMFYG
jgi:hypothetical protein